jgi:hypothetical protein
MLHFHRRSLMDTLQPGIVSIAGFAHVQRQERKGGDLQECGPGRNGASRLSITNDK